MANTVRAGPAVRFDGFSVGCAARIALLASWGFILLGAFLFIASAIDVLSRRPADVPLEPVRLWLAIILAVVGIGCIIVGSVQWRGVLRQYDLNGQIGDRSSHRNDPRNIPGWVPGHHR
ncbi:hypothetical protein [Leifsonia sp. P73]|uniref:hypothetical protein n=1 Tax=Leifsonia sp. P73 TaxID=3423959 RepID=UPI003DA3B5C3